AEICCAINMRSQTKSIFSASMLKNFNWWLLGAVLITVAITLSAIYVPGLCNVFGIEAGTFQINELMICVFLALTTFPAFEIGKMIRRKRYEN
ncbi:MAG: cation transporting ATPase C-terminal domain-containing protein, partial [Erysipelotrichaceae bacterium]|nr:cation transporting ATPase C-terminal domain-containing protein [Erysipelotrichaceae bacterium]